ncbi:MAG: exosome complex exonuclease Rrp41 [Candidatus Diapherotrites archaeon CG11_big_fil_rev_8_21_14_0_20_37_9]|nr:MAG: exosome complex exonuclease Rrp41 [Candidatus Diapherotrites archaeon CG11_big_fil_rev_8_21_14_0_20_37_9]
MAGKKDELVYVDSKGKRVDGRKVEDLRPIKIEVGVIPQADGSAYLEWGQNKAFASVYGPRECLPKHSASPYKAVVKFNYRMATFSVPDRKNPRPGRREYEISKVCGEALERSIFVERFPNTQIDVTVELFDSNAGSRIAGLCAASVALADAGIPMRGLVCGTGVGKAGGKIIVDLDKTEEDAPDAVDIPLAIISNTKEVVLMQLDGILSKKEWQQAMKMGIDASLKVHEIQKAALKARYENVKGDDKK